MGEGLLAGPRIDRLILAKSGGREPYGDTPLLIKYCTTEMARAADRSQFDLNGDVGLTGRTSV